MLSHIFYKKLDPQWPASLSDNIAKTLLRDQLGFNGLVMTDDLDMGAIAKHFDIKTAMRRIVAAEIDLALICHKGPNIEVAYKEVLQGIIDSADVKARGITSVRRIMRAKKKYVYP
jgi:beta-N-acetylhexosaminidase